MRTRVTIPPVAEPLDLAAMRQQLRLPAGYVDEDAVLQRVVRAGRHLVERWTWRRLLDQELELVACGFAGQRGAGLTMPTAPVTSIVSIAYTDAAGAVQALDPAAYYLDESDGDPATLRPTAGHSWPAVETRCAAPVRVLIRAGWPDVAALQAAAEDLVAATALMATHLYDFRGQQQTGTIVSRNVLTAQEIAAPWRLPVVP